MTKLEELCQLHEEIRIVYVVDGYSAELWTHDGDTLVMTAKADSIAEALQLLEFECGEMTLVDVRAAK